MEKNKIETGFSSDAKTEPRRVVFVTKKTSAKVVGDPGPGDAFDVFGHQFGQAGRVDGGADGDDGVGADALL